MSFIEEFANIDLGLHGVRLPEYQLPSGEVKILGLKPEISNYEFLRELTLNGFREKVKFKKGSDEYNEYVDRVKKELSIISELGFTDYVLLVWDVVNFCRKNDIATGVGRGSCCGSLVLFLTDVTKVDPIVNGLYFERFISKIRAKKTVVGGITYLDGSLLMDVDLDISYSERIKVIEYVQNKFQGRTCKILTLNTLSGKLLIKECGKVVASKTEQEMSQVSDMIPKHFGIVMDIEEAYETEKKFQEWCKANPDIFEIALKLRDLIKNKGCHASGYVVSHDPLEQVCPVELSSDKEIVSGYDMEWMSRLTVKLDLLGLRAASLVHDVCKMVGIKIGDINLEDKLIYDNLQMLQTPHGLFQIEADCAFRTLQKVKPRSLEHLSAVLAIARPGALEFVDQYAKSLETGEYIPTHPFFDEVLKLTGGVPLYQEQLMKMSTMVGFTLDEAEVLRRIVGKKKVDEVKEWQKKIEDKVKENNLPKEVGEVLWKLLNNSAKYSFNKSHSIAYASLSAATAYIKFKYPKEFFLALLRLTRFEPDPLTEITKIHQELRMFDIQLLPPSLIKSDLDFQIEGNGIRFGLLSIKGISDKSIEKISRFRKESFSNKFEVFESAYQAGLSIGILSALIQAGTLDNISPKRSRTVLEAQLWNLLSDKERVNSLQLGSRFGFDLFKVIKHMTETKDEKGKPMVKAKRFETIKKHYAPYKKIYELNSQSEDFANWWYEKTLLGFTYGKKLIDIFKGSCPRLEPIDRVNILDAKTSCMFVGTVESVYEGTSRKEKKTRYFKVVVRDETGSITALLFNDNIDAHKDSNGGAAEEGNIVVVKGRKMNDAIFADWINVQDHKIYMKLGELKQEKVDKKD